MKLVITGSSGFLGTNLIQELLNSTDYNIIAFTTNPNKLRNRYLMCDGRLMVISDIDAIKWNEVDILLNLAFPRNNDGVQMAKGLKYISDLFMAAREGGVGAAINISSQSVYSQYRIEPATEETELDLESIYAVGKYASELLLNGICKDIPHTNIRLASLIGTGFDQRITNILIKKVYCGEPIRIISGSQHFGFMDVRDAIDAIKELILSNPSRWKEQYNIGINGSYTLEEIANCVVDIYLSREGKNITYDIEYSDSKQNSQLNCNLFKEEFGWEAKYKLRDSLEKIYDDYILYK